ncbi:GspE/PulE family protein [Sulfuricurvum sp.]|uniref:GspE/PulE family protein n=1 Tax=Sulfuricurvum sp. TaxID=2025608 RepID=UPI00261A834B|nr:GspE/PulE family protein [Sulfuricurvum sp.]MDD2265912.1 GspE/PulE family protein [Sulfuricurvum sp.]MDD2782932.1 GspE/PulE family protein [Sulfuricurvum sp.]
MIRQQVRLGDLLISESLITQEQLEYALAQQKNSGFTKKLGEVLVEEGMISHKEMALLLSKQLKIDFVDLFGEKIDFLSLAKFSISLLTAAKAIPFKEDEDYVYIATSDPLNFDALEALERNIATKPIKVYLSLSEDIAHIFQRLEIIKKTQSIAAEVKKEINNEGSKGAEGDASSVMQLISLMIKDAILRRASDLHIEPELRSMSVRARVDGILQETFVFDLDIYTALSSRIKLLGNLDISERRKAQDGRFSLDVAGGKYDFRLSTTPTLFGESIVMRILDQQKILLKLHELGFDGKNLDKFNEIIHAPFGIVLITGPTGSGKTTTLYAALNEVKSIENKVLTIEDPIEYQLPLVQQVQVNERVGFSFLEALKSFLRQDPDIILVGEIRDFETLNSAAQASLTGHLVFSTLHTNDAPSAIGRMVQMGLQSYLIADSLVGIVAQRLVRKICTECKHEVRPHKNLLRRIERWLPEDAKFYAGQGCSKCNNTGYSGRILISEILMVNETIAKMISDESSKYEIARYAQEKEGFEPMIVDGLSKVLGGITTLDEVLRVTKEM